MRKPSFSKFHVVAFESKSSKSKTLFLFLSMVKRGKGEKEKGDSLSPGGPGKVLEQRRGSGLSQKEVGMRRRLLCTILSWPGLCVILRGGDWRLGGSARCTGARALNFWT